MQGGEKHFVKTVPGSGTPVSSSIINPGNSQTRPVASTTGSVQIAARTVLQLFLLLLLVRLLQPVLQVTLIIKYLEVTIFHCICRHLGGTPVVFSGGVKNITPLSNVTSIGKVGFIHFVWQYVLLMCVGLGFSAKHCCIPSNVGTCCWNQNWFFSTICYDRNSSW